MDEITRQEYLQNMGIQSYFPRYILPAALISEQCVWPEVNEQKPAAEELPVLAELPAIKAELRSEPEPEPGKANKPASAVSTVSSHGALETDEIRFQLAFIQLNDAVLALILLPHVQARQGLSQAQKQLFKNICSALNHAPGNLNFEIKPFIWPFGESVHIDKSEAAAKTALGAYMAQLRDVYKYTQLLIMGENIIRLVTAETDCEITACRSLDEMLKMPRLKREVWQQIKRAKLATAD